MTLTREQILEANDIQKEKVNVPEWGGDIYVKGLSGIANEEFQESIIEIKEDGKRKVTYKYMRAKLLALTICDETGKLLFSEADIKALDDKSSYVLSILYEIAQRLSGLTKGDIENLRKNL
jgi:hypothetical protein